MRSYNNLSDHDFERLVADLFGKLEGRRYETFARGPDLGVDARSIAPDGMHHVLQCKHMVGSSFSQLLAAARAERARLDRLPPDQRPSTYRFITSKPLTARNKHTLQEVLEPYVRVDNDIWAADDLEQLLDEHPEVERAHVKLWLTARAQLEGVVNAAIWTRSAALMEQIKRTVPLYVQTDQWAQARDMLAEFRVVVLSGPPGIGKTTLADMLLADAVARGYEPIRVSADITEAEQIENALDKQVFYYDDFLGSAFLDLRVRKNEDQRLEQFIERCTASSNKLFILTTREHLLQAALDIYEQLSYGALPLRKVTLEMKDYSRLQRAEVIYNHMRTSPHVGAAVRRQLADRDAYLKLVDHRRFRPRLISYLAGSAFNSNVPGPDTWLDEAVAALDDPTRVWKTAFSHQLGDAEKIAVVALASLPERIDLDVGEAAYAALWSAQPVDRPIGVALQEVLRVTEGTFTRTNRRSPGQFELALHDPSVQDFVAEWLRPRPIDLRRALEGTSYLEQVFWLYSAAIRDLPIAHSLLPLVAARLQVLFCRGASCTPGRSPDDWLRAIEVLVADDVQLRSLLPWLDQQFLDRVTQWNDGTVSVDAALGLVLQLKKRRVDTSAGTAALRDYVAGQIDQFSADRSDWDDFIAVTSQLAPDGDEALSDRRDKFLDWAQTCLCDGAADLNDLDDLHALVATGEGFGGGVDDLAFFEDVKARFESKAWEPDNDEWRTPPGATTYDVDRESRQIDALFARFADE